MYIKLDFKPNLGMGFFFGTEEVIGLYEFKMC